MMMEQRDIQPLDLVITEKGGLAVVSQVTNDGLIGLRFLRACNIANEHSSWWDRNDGLRIIDSIPRILANCMGSESCLNSDQGSYYFPIDALDCQSRADFDEEFEDEDD